MIRESITVLAVMGVLFVTFVLGYGSGWNGAKASNIAAIVAEMNGKPTEVAQVTGPLLYCSDGGPECVSGVMRPSPTCLTITTPEHKEFQR